MKKHLHWVVYIVLLTPCAHSVECSSKVLKTQKIYNLPGAGYWMQAAGDCRLTYTSVGGVGSKLFNMCTNKPEQITANIDAYPLPGGDGEVYVHPTDGISFYKFKDAAALAPENLRRGVPIYKDPALQGNYESIGLLKGSTPDHRTIRIAMGNAGGTFRDYTVDKENDNYHITPVQPNTVRVCKNLPSGGLETELPILSRDGTMIAGREFNSRKSQVFRLDSESGACTPIRGIPLSTSKVSFTFDNKNILYVVIDPNTNKGRLIAMNVESGTTTTMSGPDEDVMYMTAKEDGTILYSRRGIDDAPQSTTGMGGLVSLERNRPADQSVSDLVELDPKLFDTAEPKKYEALGLMWGDACEKDLDLDYALAVGQRFNSKFCSDVVTDKAVANLDIDHKFTKIDLMAACNGNAQPERKTRASRISR